MKDYTRERRVMSMFVIIMVVLFFISSIIIVFNLNKICLNDCTDIILRLFSFSTMAFPAMLLYVYKNHYLIWRNIFLCGTFLSLLNLTRSYEGLDYMMTGPIGFTIVISCLTFIVLLFVLFTLNIVVKSNI